MSIQNEMPGYNEMNQYLNQQGTGLTPAEMHGLISGMICGGNDDSSWLPLLHDLTNEGMAFGHELAQALRKMHSATIAALMTVYDQELLMKELRKLTGQPTECCSSPKYGKQENAPDNP